MIRILTALIAATIASDVADAKPNIVFILADDLGYGDVGCYNPASKIPTPHLDKLAVQGARFTDAHAPAAVCTPTRYSLLTGRYSWRSPLKRGVLGPWGGPLIGADRLTVPGLLTQHGYATACIGKWHLGWTWPTTDGKPAASGASRLSNVDYTKPITNGPVSRGFGYYFGVDVPNYPPYCFIENDKVTAVPSETDTGRADLFNHPGPMAPGWKLVNVLPKLADRAETWIHDTAKTGKPFFLYLPLTSPHYPVVPAAEFKGTSKAGDFGDFVVQTDAVVGRVMAALAKAGVAENTLVIVTSDNGPEVSGEVNPGVYDRLQQFDHASMGGLRGVKRDLHEGGHRVPFIASWPKRIPVGHVSAETICHVDLMATVAGLLGTTLPASAGEDSFDILPALLGQADKPLRPATVHHGITGKLAIRRGDWVYLEGDGDSNGAKGEPEWFRQARGYGAKAPGEALFHLKDDPSQKSNRITGDAAVAAELKSLLEKYRQDGRSTPGAVQKNDPPLAAAPKAKS